jgi:hypothetical protein
MLWYLIWSLLIGPMKLITNSKNHSSNPLQMLCFWPCKYLHSCIQWVVDNWRKSTKWQIGKLHVWWPYVTCLHLFSFIQYVHSYIIHSFINNLHIFTAIGSMGRTSVGCRAEIRTPAAIQQACALPTEPRCTLREESWYGNYASDSGPILYISNGFYRRQQNLYLFFSSSRHSKHV